MTHSTPTPIGSRASNWGEGPVWWDNALWYVDIEGQSLIRLNPESGDETTWPMGQRIGFALPCGDGQWIWGGDNGLYTFDPTSGESTFMTDPEPDKPNNRFNDAAISPDGRLFAGTIATDKAEGAASLYRLDAGSDLKTAVPKVTNSNGIAWSPDESRCYYIDTPTRTVRRFRYKDGELLDPETFLDTDPVIDASPDGMCTDSEGHLWIAFCHGGCVMKFDHQSGDILQRIDLPCRETTSCCFGGPDLRDLYITTGVPGQNPEPLAGRVFVVKELDVAGMAQRCFGG